MVPAFAPMVNMEVADPIKAPLLIEAGKITAQFKVSVFPFKSMVPLLWVNAFDTVKLLPNLRVPEDVRSIMNWYKVSVVINVSVPQSPVPLIKRIELLLPLTEPPPVTLPVSVVETVFTVLSWKITPVRMFKLFVTLVFSRFANDFVPVPPRVRS